MSDAIVAIAKYVARTGFDAIPASAVKAAKTFMLDSFGVGLAGLGCAMRRRRNRGLRRAM